MKVKNDETSDEVVKLLESCGVSLTDKEKETLRKHREDQQQMQENMTADYQRAELVHLCRLGRSGKALIQKSLNSYLARCRNSAKSQRGKIDVKQIYASRRI